MVGKKLETETDFVHSFFAPKVSTNAGIKPSSPNDAFSSATFSTWHFRLQWSKAFAKEYGVFPNRPQGRGACVCYAYTTGQGPRTHEIGLPWAPGEGGVEQMKC